jgi:hypothetical protein
MGEVIHKKAARERIIEDTRTTLARAAAKAIVASGGPWGAAAPRIGPIVALWDTTTVKRDAARAELAPLAATASATNDAVDDRIKALADEIWNEIGRPQNDPYFDMLFPGGTGFYVDGNPNEQPAQMELLAELLDAKLHPRLTNAPAQAAVVRAEAAKLEAATEATRKPAARVELYDRMLTAIARSAQVELSKLKRFWKAEGLSESDIHSVIPDRPRNYGVGTPTNPTAPASPVAPTEPTS